MISISKHIKLKIKNRDHYKMCLGLKVFMLEKKCSRLWVRLFNRLKQFSCFLLMKKKNRESFYKFICNDLFIIYYYLFFVLLEM